MSVTRGISKILGRKHVGVIVSVLKNAKKCTSHNILESSGDRLMTCWGLWDEGGRLLETMFEILYNSMNVSQMFKGRVGILH